MHSVNKCFLGNNWIECLTSVLWVLYCWTGSELKSLRLSCELLYLWSLRFADGSSAWIIQIGRVLTKCSWRKWILLTGKQILAIFCSESLLSWVVPRCQRRIITSHLFFLSRPLQTFPWTHCNPPTVLSASRITSQGCRGDLKSGETYYNPYKCSWWILNRWCNVWTVVGIN